MARVSVWAYPWDVHDIGLDAALDRITQAGGNCVSLATSYHAGRFLQPGNPRRKVYFPQDGTVYYRLDPARWQGRTIRALEADVVAAEGDSLAARVTSCAQPMATRISMPCAPAALLRATMWQHS
jgi:hypothetical protein